MRRVLRHISFYISVLSFFLPVLSHAGPAADKIAERIEEPYRGYSKTCGYPIIFRRILSISLARIDKRLGPIIVLDPFLKHRSQGAHQRFLIAHECAHHLLGHTAPKGLRERATQPKGVENQELSADCWAAETLVQAELFADVRFVTDVCFRRGLHPPGSGYPSGVQRSTMIYHCFNSAIRDAEEQSTGQ